MVIRSWLLLAMLRVLSYAQTGSVQGRVVDPTEAVIPFANVELRTKPNATLVQNMRTDLHGGFSFTAVAPGNYDLLVSMQGFEPHRQSIKVSEAEAMDLRTISLALGAI